MSAAANIPTVVMTRVYARVRVDDLHAFLPSFFKVAVCDMSACRIQAAVVAGCLECLFPH